MRGATIGLVLLLTACGGGAEGGGADANSAEGEAPAAMLADGAAFFQSRCASCHTLQPPPLLAPPMSHVAMRYRAEVEDSAAFVERIMAWVPAPAEDRSLMPAQAIAQFGLMPAQAVPRPELEAIAGYIYGLQAEGGMGAGGAMEGHGGMGGGMGGMNGPMHEGMGGAGGGTGPMHEGMPQGGAMPGGMPGGPGMPRGMPADSAR